MGFADFIQSGNTDWHLPCVEPVLGIAQEDGGSSLLSMDVQSLWNRERHEVSCLGPTWS